MSPSIIIKYNDGGPNFSRGSISLENQEGFYQGQL